MEEGSSNSFPIGRYTATAKFLKDYLESCEHLPDDIAKLMSRYKECDRSSGALLNEIEGITGNLRNQELYQKLKDYNSVKKTKMELAELINQKITENVQSLSTMKTISVMEIKNYQSGSSGSDDSLHELPPSAKVRKALIFEDVHSDTSTSYHTASDRSTGNVYSTVGPEWDDLKMLADVASLRKDKEDQILRESITPSRKPKINRKVKKSVEKVIELKSGDESEKEKDRPRKKKAQPKKLRETIEIKSEPETEIDEELERPPVKYKKRLNAESKNADDSESEPLYCICNKPSHGRMIACEHESCVLEWFHFNCVQLKRAPKGKWFCPKCRSKKANILKKEFNA